MCLCGRLSFGGLPQGQAGQVVLARHVLQKGEHIENLINHVCGQTGPIVRFDQSPQSSMPDVPIFMLSVYLKSVRCEPTPNAHLEDRSADAPGA